MMNHNVKSIFKMEIKTLALKSIYFQYTEDHAQVIKAKAGVTGADVAEFLKNYQQVEEVEGTILCFF